MKKSVEPVTDGKADKGREHEIQTYRACLKQLSEKRLLCQVFLPLSKIFVLAVEKINRDPGDLPVEEGLRLSLHFLAVIRRPIH